MPDADRIAAAVLACPSVAGLHGGRFGEVATYLPGRRVTGVRITPTGLSVHLIARYPATITEVDTAVRAALAPQIGALTLTVAVEDIVADASEVGAPDATPPARPHTHPSKENLP